MVGRNPKGSLYQNKSDGLPYIACKLGAHWFGISIIIPFIERRSIDVYFLCTHFLYFQIVIRMDYSLTLLQFLTSYVNGILGSSNHYTTLRMSKLRHWDNAECWCRETRFAELIMPMPCDPAPVLLGVCCREGKTQAHPKPCTEVFAAAWFGIVVMSRNWAQLKCLSAGDLTIGVTQAGTAELKSGYTQQPEWISREMCWMTKVNLNRSHTMILFIWHSWNDKDEWMVAVGWGGDGRKGLWL